MPMTKGVGALLSVVLVAAVALLVARRLQPTQRAPADAPPAGF